MFFADILHKDPALWPLKLHENKNKRTYFLDKGYEFFQNKKSNFKLSKREYPTQSRYFSPNFFYRKLKNDEKCDRKWLMYSESQGTVFCYVCKLFSLDEENVFVKKGFSNWKKGEETISSHENGKEHNRCMIDWLNCIHEDSHVDKGLVNAMKSEIAYWTEILRRVIAAILYLAERGLAFRGSNEVIGLPHNGNYLGALELIAKFDPFLKEHIDMNANKGRGRISYLSKTICEEIIQLMAKKVMARIKEEIKQTKYWGLVVDSTPDISHADQLSIIFRYYWKGHIYERFFCFLQIKSHTGKSLSTDILELLKENEIEIENCRAQSYDNASNMSGKYSGLQACIKKENTLAVYVPCVGHSLNLVGECSMNEALHAINFFGLLQNLYVFFSSSTHRWDVLKHENSTLTSLSATRWSCKADATNAITKNFDGVYNALKVLSEDSTQKSDTRREALSLLKKIIKLENAFMAVLWHRILSRFNLTSIYVQKVEVDLYAANEMLVSLVDFIQNLRCEFINIENESKNLSEFVISEYSDSNKRVVTKKLRDGEKEISTLTGSDKFRIATFYVIIDKLSAELKKRSEAYTQIIELFGFLCNLTTISREEIQTKALNLVRTYSKDLQDNLVSELEQFTALINLQPKGFFSNSSSNPKPSNSSNSFNFLAPLKVLNWIVDRQMVDVFPNVYISYRIFVTAPIANCEAERSFSVLKRVKNMYRATMLDDRLSALSSLAIESELLRSMDFEDLIHDFANSKSRKKTFT